MKRRWYEGTPDPLDQPKKQHGDWVQQQLDPRKPVQEQTVQSVETLPESSDPLDVLIHCEECDEAEGCECGTHLQEYYSHYQLTITMKGNKP